ncbi:MAG: hypothetical protein IT373_01605, partial [Polyangiaceae bacterium]|nr:hypothetical protein [Polyangiaceae bacterium]
DPTIYVFIPDMHMPLLCGRRPAGDDGPAMGRVRYSEHGPSAVHDWFTLYERADLFQDAGTDMLTFLTRLETFAREHGERPLKVVQLGDMIDLWIGFERYFAETPANARAVHLLTGQPLTGAAFVCHWGACASASTAGGSRSHRSGSAVARTCSRDSKSCLATLSWSTLGVAPGAQSRPRSSSSCDASLQSRRQSRSRPRGQPSAGGRFTSRASRCTAA